jgi:hypothetical protein
MSNQVTSVLASVAAFYVAIKKQTVPTIAATW